jgi:hypothetical protein
VIEAHHLGEPGRDAEILEALGPDGARESLLFPGSDAFIDHLTRASGE